MSLSQPVKKALNEIKKKPPEKLDRMVQAIHEEVFAETDCLTCAQCCKKISPIMCRHDITRLAKATKMNLEAFVAKYVTIDNDDDYVFKTTPCPFLASNNWCDVYDSRPTSCRDYPHTDRRRFHQLIDLSIKNADICPAVDTILEQLVKSLTKK